MGTWGDRGERGGTFGDSGVPSHRPRGSVTIPSPPISRYRRWGRSLRGQLPRPSTWPRPPGTTSAGPIGTSQHQSTPGNTSVHQ